MSKYQLIVTPIDMATTVEPSMMESADHEYVIEGDYGYVGSFPSFAKAYKFATEECAFMVEQGYDVEVAING